MLKISRLQIEAYVSVRFSGVAQIQAYLEELLVPRLVASGFTCTIYPTPKVTHFLLHAGLKAKACRQSLAMVTAT